VHAGKPETDAVIDHLWLRVRSVAAARSFYAAVAPVLGLDVGPLSKLFTVHGAQSFTMLEGQPTEHVHIAFPAPDAATVEAFHRAALEAGYRDNGAPGERPQYHRGYFGAFVLDPDGNNVEAVFHGD
jgi:catechol 2,3-dioxygenase-like lactoylglutathione lyase family enzyme